MYDSSQTRDGLVLSALSRVHSIKEKSHQFASKRLAWRTTSKEEVMAIQFKRQEPETYVAISDCEVIVTEVSVIGIRKITMLNIETAIPFDVLAWINLLRRDDGGLCI
jgi:hypothetical protein